MRTHKRKKSSRMHGRKMGTHGTGFRKKAKGTGHRGGKGMSGSGKRNDQKKTLVLKLYGNSYFGKQGVTSRSNKPDKRDRINLSQIASSLQSMVARGKAEIKGKDYTLKLPGYILLGNGNIEELKKHSVTIHASAATAGAQEKMKAAGWKLVLPKQPEETSAPSKKEE